MTTDPMAATQIAHKPLYRYLESKFVESFFDCGSLFLTTYARCRKHEDSVRRDEGEGKFNFHLQHGQSAIAVMQTSGDRSYMLCTSLVGSKELADRFGTDSHIKIVDPSGFFDAVAAALPRLEARKYGACEYLAERSEMKLLQAPLQPDMSKLLAAKALGGRGNVEELFYEMHSDFSRRVSDQMSDVGYFAKPNVFAIEKEFRMIWTMRDEVGDGKLIQCPDARKFCERGSRF